MTHLRNGATIAMSREKRPMKLKDTIRTFVDSKGNSWEWIETQEVRDAIAKYWRLVEENANG